MSTPLQNSDLERTDVLPQLDVAAYEAGLADGEEAQTGTWSVEGLQDAVAAEEEAARSITSTQHLPTPGVVNLLERVDRLEVELATLRSEYAQLEARHAELTRVHAGTVAEHANASRDMERLIEQAQLARSHFEAQSQRHAQELAERHDQLAALEQQAKTSTTQREQLQRALAELQASAGQLRLTVEQQALALREQEATIASLRTAHAEQQHAASHLARLLAGKMSETEHAHSPSRSQNDEVAGLQRVLQERLNQIGALELRVEELEGENTRLSTALHDAGTASAVVAAQANETQQTMELELPAVELAIQTFGASGDYKVAGDFPAPAPPVSPGSDHESVLLELAATRAEVQRYARVHEDLERAVRVRDDLLATLRHEVQTAQEERGILALQLQKARTRMNEMAERIFEKDVRLSALRSGAASEEHEVDAPAPRDPATERVLQPMNDADPTIVLDRKIMTVGRTDESDVCVPSKLVSRHHARLLVGANSVVVIDAGSTNGCYVNDQEVKKETIREGDVVRFGDRAYRLVFRPKQRSEPRDYSDVPPQVPQI